jgi:hypothetical protein
LTASTTASASTPLAKASMQKPIGDFRPLTSTLVNGTESRLASALVSVLAVAASPGDAVSVNPAQTHCPNMGGV